MLYCGNGFSADWKSIQPVRTTEKDLVAAFGDPQEVVASFPWAEWSARWKIRPASDNHLLRYRSDAAPSPLLNGPGGRADEAEVDVFKGVVHSVTWSYGGPAAQKAAQTLRSDPNARFMAPDAPSTGSIGLPQGVVFIDIGRNNTTVKVRLELK